MHSFHQSRGRILFEAACALIISASCVGAWMDLGVQAFLPAAAVSALYGLVRLFDMRRPKPAVAIAAPVVTMVETDFQGDLPTDVGASAQAPVAERDASVEPVEEPLLVEDAATVEKTKPAAKPRARKPRSSRKAEPVPTAEPVVEAVVEVELVEEAASPVAETEPAAPQVWDEPEEHAPVTPLFEPEPFVRMPRPAFGRKSG